MGTGAAEREAQSIGGTIFAQIFAMVRTIVNWLMKFVDKVLSWVSEHPEGFLMGFANLYIWFT